MRAYLSLLMQMLRHLIPVLRHLILMIQLLTWTAFFQAMAPTILPGITPSMSSLRMRILPTNQTQEMYIQPLIQQVTQEATVLRAHPLARLFSISHSFSLKTAIFPASPYRPEGGSHFPGTSSQSLQAGSTREMTATFRNKSRSQNVFGLKISLSTETKGIEFGQNSFYVQRLTPGEAITLKSAITIAEDTQPGPVAVTFSLEYEDSKATAATGTEVLTFHILQQLRAELEVADIPLVVYTMDTIEIPVKAMNLGKDKLYNAKVSLEAEGLTPSQTVFLGTIEPGTAADSSMKIYVKGITDENGSLTDQIAGHFLLTYEDSSGNSYETTSDFLTGLKESQIQSLKVEEEQPQTNSWWYSILAAGGLFLICIILLLLVSLRRKSILLEEARKAASH